MKKQIFLIFIMAALLLTGCKDNKSSAKQENDNISEEETKSITLSDGSEVIWLKDNYGKKLNPRNLFGDADDTLWNSIGMPDGLPATISTFLLKSDNEYILFDTGLGDVGGQTVRHLAKYDIQPDDIKLIYLTHFHGDHIGGLITQKEGTVTKVFPNAKIYASSAEYKAWMEQIENNALQKQIMGLYQDQLHLFEFGDVLPLNVTAIDAVGHTPGHTAFRYNELLIIGDLMHGYALQKDHPEINSIYDIDKISSVASRVRLLEYAKKNNLIMAGMHFPEPGFVK